MSSEKDIALLRGVATFDMLSGDALALLAEGAESVRLAAGERLFAMGAAATCAYVVASGRIRLLDERKADAPRALKDVGAGTLIGETALVVATPRPTGAMALEGAELLKIERAAFLAVLERSPEAAAKLRRAVAKRLEETLRALDAVRVKLEDQRQRRRR